MIKSLLQLLLLILLYLPGHSQISGCTDPLAENYDESATLNDGSCTYSSAAINPESSVELNETISSTSGLTLWNNQILTHNDHKDVTIYAIDTADGNVIQTYNLQSISNTDWEEISQDEDYFYLGDFGNNGHGNRTDLHILRISKASLADEPIIDTIHFSYNNQTDFTGTEPNATDFDCEAMIISQDSIYLFTKQWLSQNSAIYALSKTPGSQVAEFRGILNTGGMITGATFIEDASLLILCGYSKLLQPFLYLMYDYADYNFQSGNKRKINISQAFHQIEGVATNNGKKIYLTNEHFNQSPLLNIQQKLHVINIEQLIGPYLENIISGMEEGEMHYEFSLYPNPATNYINFKSEATVGDSNYVITNNTGTVILSGKLSSSNAKIDVTSLPPGLYFFSIPEIFNSSFRIIKEE